MKRRTFVRTAAAGVVGAAASGTATGSHGETYWTITMPFFDPEGSTDWNLRDGDTGASVSSFGSSRDAFVYVHGYNVSLSAAKIHTSDFVRPQVDQYWGSNVDVYGFMWYGKVGGFTPSSLNFATAENHAWQSATNMADFLDTLADHHSGQIHLGAHSLGGRVVLEALKNLDEEWQWDAPISSVSLWGAAVDDDQIHDKFHAACEYVDGEVWNYHNYDDGILELYHTYHNGWGARAIGEHAAWSDSDHPLPYNYHDVDVTDGTPDDSFLGNLESHTSYIEDHGVPDRIFPPQTDTSDGGSGGGGGGGGGGGTCEPRLQTYEEDGTSTRNIEEC